MLSLSHITDDTVVVNDRVVCVCFIGGCCGYLATLSALASGADNAYIFEEKFNVDDIKDDVRVSNRHDLSVDVLFTGFR